MQYWETESERHDFFKLNVPQNSSIRRWWRMNAECASDMIYISNKLRQWVSATDCDTFCFCFVPLVKESILINIVFVTSFFTPFQLHRRLHNELKAKLAPKCHGLITVQAISISNSHNLRRCFVASLKYLYVSITNILDDDAHKSIQHLICLSLCAHYTMPYTSRALREIVTSALVTFWLKIGFGGQRDALPHSFTRWTCDRLWIVNLLLCIFCICVEQTCIYRDGKWIQLKSGTLKNHSLHAGCTKQKRPI